ncbi:hypothetical protein [Oceanobacillus picturae]|nr:hypothetical protein [Oceanobacillus picturae]
MSLIREEWKSKPTKKFDVSFVPDFLNNLFEKNIQVKRCEGHED